MDAEIFDMDGTLCNVRSIRHLVSGKTRNFHAFHMQSIDCPPNDDVVKAAHEAHEAGRAVLIVTAREERFDRITSWWLLLNDVPFDDIFMRKNNDYRPDYIVKKEILARIRKAGYNPKKAWDDNPNVIQLWVEEGIPTELVEGFGFDQGDFEPA